MARRTLTDREPGHERRKRKGRGAFASSRTDPDEGLTDVDLSVKEVLPRSPMLMSRAFGNVGFKRRLLAELPNFRKRIVDFAALMEDESVGHMEFQLRNHVLMPLRMFHYEGLLRSEYGMTKVVRQAVIYVGDEVPNDPGGIKDEAGYDRSRYTVLDLKTQPSRDYLDSPNFDDALIGLLAAPPAEGREVVVDALNKRILAMPVSKRLWYVRQLAIASGLRGLAGYAREKAPMALSQTYELLAGQEPFKGMIASGERSGGLKRLRTAVASFLEGRDVKLDDRRRKALDAFDNEDRLTNLCVEIGRADEAGAVLAAFDRALGIDEPEPRDAEGLRR